MEQEQEQEQEEQEDIAGDLEKDFKVEQVFTRKRINSIVEGSDFISKNLAKRAKDVLPYYQKLSDEELASLSMYTSDYYEPINRNLRGRMTEEYTPEEREFYLNRANNVLSALTKIPSAKNQSYYRMTSGDNTSKTQQSFAKLKPGEVLYDEGFSSFSTNPEEAQKFMDPELNSTYFILNSSKLKQVDFIGVNPQEEEFLALPKEKFKVKSNEMIEDRSMGRVRVIELEDFD